MTRQIGQLTSTELDRTIAAAEWLVGIAGDGLLDKNAWAKVSTLAADCKAEEEDRATAARISRQAAMAAAEENGLVAEPGDTAP